MPHVVVITMTVDRDDPEEGVGVPARRVGRVRVELLARLGGEEPRWQIASVRRVSRLNGRGGRAE